VSADDTPTITDARDAHAALSTDPGGDADAVVAEAPDDTADTAAEAGGETNESVRRVKRLRSPVTALAALGVLLAVAIGTTAWLYVDTYRTAELTDPAAERGVLEAARAGTVASLSYAPESLEKDLNAAKSHLTGDFLNYYRQFTEQVVRPAVASKHITTSANVVGAAIAEMHPTTARALLFVNQATTSDDRQQPSVATSSVLVTMTKVDDRWLISAFDPT
jgi:Mce-associated membrane protein